MSDYEDLIRFSRKGSFRCRLGCTGACSPDDCLAHQQAIQQYESVVQRLVSTEGCIKRLQEKFLSAQKEWQLERTKLIKRQRVDPGAFLHQPAPVPSTILAPGPPATLAPGPPATLAQVSSASPAASHQTSTSSCTTQFIQLNPAPARRPGRPRNLTLDSRLFEEVLEELRREYQGAVLSHQVRTWINEDMEDYLKSLWATARKVTKEKRHPTASLHQPAPAPSTILAPAPSAILAPGPSASLAPGPPASPAARAVQLPPQPVEWMRHCSSLPVLVELLLNRIVLVAFAMSKNRIPVSALSGGEVIRVSLSLSGGRFPDG
ncbi:hypothetical protein CDAR_115641 [Caerostris darwini]|uniref:Uncharacterized protein n=1 Tax=Caerostris darwini TaxID=1538125 RepID=A0AAV4Q1V8_9ARAC|nr:hypothetical protein CDAR_115641 [Caerostris darwini]